MWGWWRASATTKDGGLCRSGAYCAVPGWQVPGAADGDGCSSFRGKGFDAFLLSQMWDCQEDRERVFRECRRQVAAVDMLAAVLPVLERADLGMDFQEALAELYLTCEAFYFQNCGKLLLLEDVRSNQIEGSNRFIRFGVNVRFFNIQGTEDIRIICSPPCSLAG